MLSNVNQPSDIKNMTDAELSSLAAELRETIISTVAKNGGHLASNLGMVETTIALHKAFDSPNDKIIFDVGHQCYTHKLLTGRREEFATLRRHGGISGFTARGESSHDVAFEGHCGTSVSVALGLAEANRLQGKNDYVVAVVGDGALTNGMIYEALNNCSGKDLNLIIVVNDNEMSISPNVGGLHRYFSKLRTNKHYWGFKHWLVKVLRHIPLIGRWLINVCKGIKDAFKRLFVKSNLFEDLGLIYLGPVDGHNLAKIGSALQEAKEKHACCVVHVLTKKGKGYTFAEERPELYHSVGPFDVSQGVQPSENTNFSSSAGQLICSAAAQDERICAITAAMCDGTGLSTFANEYPNRFFDVGIAEEHAITFAGGLSLQGMKPVVFLYSTFAQRVYDQLLHDVALQNTSLVLMLDRSGIVPGDGITHQGIFDYSLFSSIPNVTIFSPAQYSELQASFSAALANEGISIVRYPKGQETLDTLSDTDTPMLRCTSQAKEAEILLITYGRTTALAETVAAALQDRAKVGILKLIQIYPLDSGTLKEYTAFARLIYIIDEGIGSGGFAEKLTCSLSSFYKGPILSKSIPGFLSHGLQKELEDDCGLNAEQILSEIDRALEEQP